MRGQKGATGGQGACFDRRGARGRRPTRGRAEVSRKCGKKSAIVARNRGGVFTVRLAKRHLCLGGGGDFSDTVLSFFFF